MFGKHRIEGRKIRTPSTPKPLAINVTSIYTLQEPAHAAGQKSNAVCKSRVSLDLDQKMGPQQNPWVLHRACAPCQTVLQAQTTQYHGNEMEISSSSSDVKWHLFLTNGTPHYHNCKFATCISHSHFTHQMTQQKYTTTERQTPHPYPLLQHALINNQTNWIEQRLPSIHAPDNTKAEKQSRKTNHENADGKPVIWDSHKTHVKHKHKIFFLQITINSHTHATSLCFKHDRHTLRMSPAKYAIQIFNVIHDRARLNPPKCYTNKWQVRATQSTDAKENGSKLEEF